MMYEIENGLTAALRFESGDESRSATRRPIISSDPDNFELIYLQIDGVYTKLVMGAARLDLKRWI